MFQVGMLLMCGVCAVCVEYVCSVYAVLPGVWFRCVSDTCGVCNLIVLSVCVMHTCDTPVIIVLSVCLVCTWDTCAIYE